jgi:ribose transport system permease protein
MLVHTEVILRIDHFVSPRMRGGTLNGRTIMSLSPLNQARRRQGGKTAGRILAAATENRLAEGAVPLVLMLALMAAFAASNPYYASVGGVQSLMRLFAEGGLVVIAISLTLVAGGIDLSVGSNFAFANFAALYLFHVLQLPVPVVIAGTVGAGALVGALNGLLIGYLRARPFLTTMLVLIILRAVVNILSLAYSTDFAVSAASSPIWDLLSYGMILGIPLNMVALLAVIAIGHVFLSRSRLGWHITAVGASRKAARHAGIPIQTVLFKTYLLSGALCGLAGLFLAARQNAAGSDVGVGLEIQALTGAVLGGISLAGGEGSIPRAMVGAVIIFLIVNGLLILNFPGSVTSAVLGAVLLLSAWLSRALAKRKARATPVPE